MKKGWYVDDDGVRRKDIDENGVCVEGFYYGKITPGDEVEFYYQDKDGNTILIPSRIIRKDSEIDKLMHKLLREEENDR